jgi:hypothetical protein
MRSRDQEGAIDIVAPKRQSNRALVDRDDVVASWWLFLVATTTKNKVKGERGGVPENIANRQLPVDYNNMMGVLEVAKACLYLPYR